MGAVHSVSRTIAAPPRWRPGPALSGSGSWRSITTGTSASIASTAVATPLAW